MGILKSIPIKGSRNDLGDVVAAIKSGASFKDIAENHPVEFIRYHRGIRELQAQLNYQARDPANAHEVIVMVGPTAVGKSRAAKDYFDTLEEPALWKTRNKWWDGYVGQRTVIFDDHNSAWFGLDDFLRIVDRNPYNAEVKGGTVPLASTRSVFTCNRMPHRWYPNMQESWPAIRRRITELWIFTGLQRYFRIRNDLTEEGNETGAKFYERVKEFLEDPRSYVRMFFPENEEELDLRYWEQTNWPGPWNPRDKGAEAGARAASYIERVDD